MRSSTETGIGRALRSARQHQRKSIDEASRETRVRTEYLEALERESFAELGGDVYARSFLRTYAKYLGLDHQKVMSVYDRTHGPPLPRPAPVERAPGVATTEAVVLTEPRRPNWVLAALVALVGLAATASIGLFGRDGSVPEPTTVVQPPAIPVTSRTVQVGLAAHQDVEVTMLIDGRELQPFTLEEGDARSFEAQDAISVRLSEGGNTIDLTVNGRHVPAGPRHAPYQATFTPDSFRGRPSNAPGP